LVSYWAPFGHRSAFADEARFVTGTEIIVDGGMVARCD
jgi:hypothetical protein